MDALEAIFTRRSIRTFAKDPVSDEHIETLLRAGMAAPSAGNQQAWEFVVIDDRAVLEAIPRVHPYAQMCAEAPLTLAVCADPSREKYAGFWVQDCSASTQNILLAASSGGFGAFWISAPLYAQAAVRRALDLDESWQPQAFVVLGHPSADYVPFDRPPPDLELHLVRR